MRQPVAHWGDGHASLIEITRAALGWVFLGEFQVNAVQLNVGWDRLLGQRAGCWRG